MEDFTCLYLALAQQYEQPQETSQPAPRQHLSLTHPTQQWQPATIVEDDRDQPIALYPTLYL
ncbi:MAG TPA: hypothetical protein V6C64_10180 [Microcoleaceae cyanobacterium]